jgi:hypothetical protein
VSGCAEVSVNSEATGTKYLFLILCCIFSRCNQTICHLEEAQKSADRENAGIAFSHPLWSVDV